MPAFTDIFKDNLDTFLDSAIKDRFKEDQRERPEGAAERANPHVIAQPLHPSQFPGGQPRNLVAGVSNSTLLMAGGALLVLLMIVLLVIRSK